MLVKYEPIQDRKRHEFKAKKSTQNLPSKWVRKHKFLIQRLSCLSGFLRYTLYCSGDESEAKTEGPAINTAVSGQWLLSVPDDCAKQSCLFHLIALHSEVRVVSKWYRLEGMKLTWGVKGTAERRSEESSRIRGCVVLQRISCRAPTEGMVSVEIQQKENARSGFYRSRDSLPINIFLCFTDWLSLNRCDVTNKNSATNVKSIS